VTATKSRQLAGRRERGCESFADSPGDKWCQPPKLGEACDRAGLKTSADLAAMLRPLAYAYKESRPSLIA
jgi:hypothetical protein